jgi:type I restriction enzyme S subunit
LGDNLHYEKFADGSVKCIEDEIPFDLPEGWAWVRLGNLSAAIQYGLSNSAEPQGTHRLLRITDIQDGKVDWNAVPFTTVNDPEAYLLKTGDIVFARTGATVGKSFLITETPYPSVYASYLIRIRLLGSLSPEYIYQFFDSACYWSQITDKSVGVGQPNCNGTSLKELFIPLPPISEQLRIVPTAQALLAYVAKIDAEKKSLLSIIMATKSKILDLAIRGQLIPQDPNDEPASVLLERIRAEKEELIKQGKIKRDKKESVIFRGEDNSYYEKMPDGKLHCLDDQLPFELPDGWEWCNLSMIGTTNIGLTYRPTNIEPDGVIVLRSCNIVNDQVDLSDLVRVKTTIRENQYVQKNDILICARNGSRALVGKCALIPDLGEPASFGAFMAIYRTEYFEYIVHYLRSSFFRSVFDDSNSTAINQLTQDMLKRAIVPLPPVFEQRRITETIDAMLFELNQMEKSLI